MRVPQLKEKPKGSQKWLQEIINTCPDYLNRLIQQKLTSLSGQEICWKSPLKQDEYAEYRDTDFLKQIRLADLSEKLNHFWPKIGPQWDALGKTSDGKIYILVEAKANVPELVSFCGAKDKESLKTISESLNETQRWLNCKEPCIDWKYGFYQYANRLAHLYFLSEKAHLEAYLIFLYFVEDFNHIPTSQDAWSSALKLQKKLMGLSTGNLTDKVIELFININEINT
jgi:hypothetical protein